MLDRVVEATVDQALQAPAASREGVFGNRYTIGVVPDPYRVDAVGDKTEGVGAASAEEKEIKALRNCSAGRAAGKASVASVPGGRVDADPAAAGNRPEGRLVTIGPGTLGEGRVEAAALPV